MHGIGSTAENLQDAANGEHGEWTDMYKRMADEADAEGFTEIARMMRGVAAIEKTHEERYLLLNDRIENGEVFTRAGVNAWICTTAATSTLARARRKPAPSAPIRRHTFTSWRKIIKIPSWKICRRLTFRRLFYYVFILTYCLTKYIICNAYNNMHIII